MFLHPLTDPEIDEFEDIQPFRWTFGNKTTPHYEFPTNLG